MSDDYTPDEQELLAAWIWAHSEPGWGGPVDIGGQPKERIAEGKRALARVKRDAAREALDGLVEMLHVDTEFLAFGTGEEFKLAIELAETYRDDEYPEETPHV